MATDIILNDNEILLKGLKVSVQKNIVIGTGLKQTRINDSRIFSDNIVLKTRLSTKKLSAASADIGILNIASIVGDRSTPGKITIGKGASATLITDKEIKCNKLTARKVTELSDARCKQDINVLSNSIDKIISLQGVSFNWNENELTGLNPSKDKQIGFIAQDVEKIIPEAVTKDAKGRYSLAYTSVIPLLVEGMKTQQENIQLLRETIKLESEENKRLIKRVSEIEHRLSDTEKKLAAYLSRN